MTYPFTTISDLFDNVTCARDIKEIDDYIHTNVAHYTDEELAAMYQTLGIMRELWG